MTPDHEGLLRDVASSAAKPCGATGRVSGVSSTRTSSPVGFTRNAGGTTAVRVHQVVRDLAGEVAPDTFVEHVYRFEDGLIARMDVGAD